MLNDLVVGGEANDKRPGANAYFGWNKFNMMDDPLMAYNLRFFQQYFFGLWIWARSWLIIPATYVCAAYCCLFELYLDTFYDASLRKRVEDWSNSTLLKQAPKEKRIAVLTGADGTIGTQVDGL